MEFTISCPVDGPVEVGLEDIDNVVLRESDRADITFVCPHCGSQIGVTAIVPAFLLSAIEALADDSRDGDQRGFVVVGQAAASQASALDSDGGHDEAYCEYFRRQLEGIETVDDVLSEIDSGRSSV